ncbi:hypothetical protein HUK80_05305 [Flavobacterium sp. MAH-1]|uniref:YD repeat-containing protein n=1 Tax=Flavobacterium agri TaxID=2743471 RepID=A0A7Y8Y0L6_9FLAO|nr:hypothetical protein [Flavobacterium agri]NUY80303.1 hypothetical protein [Flavobacterium agri]NYA70328.1 hypothetical protein [Flavobacterium agri]
MYPEWSETIEYAYNAKGLVSRAKFTSNGKTTICEFKYTFDHKNNWIEQTKTVNGKPLYLRKRTITYYD